MRSLLYIYLKHFDSNQVQLMRVFISAMCTARVIFLVGIVFHSLGGESQITAMMSVGTPSWHHRPSVASLINL